MGENTLLCWLPACSGFLYLLLQGRNKYRIWMSSYFPPGPKWANRQVKPPGLARRGKAPRSCLPAGFPLLTDPRPSGLHPFFPSGSHPGAGLAHQRRPVLWTESCGRRLALNYGLHTALQALSLFINPGLSLSLWHLEAL